MVRKQGAALGITAIGIYLLGGLALIGFMKDGICWGGGRSIGYLFLCVGLSLSVLAVLLMRIFRNRGRG